ncbi:MAG: Spy/CpxP family protein refolding chaperone [Comamonas sp.]
MQRFQRTLATAIAAAALLGTAALSAHAQPQPAAAPHQAAAAAHGPRAGHIDFAKIRAERTEHLKTVLQIQPSQQGAWDAYVKAITPAPRAKADGSTRPDLRKLTTPERLDLAQKLRKERTAKAEQREQATRSFYASLNPSQQKAFDAISAQRHGKPGMHKAGHGKRSDGPRGMHRGHGPAGHHPATAAPVAPAA